MDSQFEATYLSRFIFSRYKVLLSYMFRLSMSYESMTSRVYVADLLKYLR